MKFNEFIEYLDGIIDYDKIVAEYGLSYSEIKMAIEKMRDVMADRHLTSTMHSDAQKQCPSCVDAVLGNVSTCPKCGYFERR